MFRCVLNCNYYYYTMGSIQARRQNAIIILSHVPLPLHSPPPPSPPRPPHPPLMMKLINIYIPVLWCWCRIPWRWLGIYDWRIAWGVVDRARDSGCPLGISVGKKALQKSPPCGWWAGHSISLIYRRKTNQFQLYLLVMNKNQTTIVIKIIIWLFLLKKNYKMWN